METEISTNIPQEEAFEEILNYVQRKRYSWILGITSKYDVRNLVPPSQMEIRSWPSWAYTFTGRMCIKVMPINESRSLVKMNFEWFKPDALAKLLVLGFIVLLSAFNPIFTPIIILLGIPYFLGWLGVIRLKRHLTTELRRLFQTTN